MDKYLHLVTFWMLGSILGWRARAIFLVSLLLALIALAAVIEWAQALYTLDRSPELKDALFGVAGGVIGLALGWRLGQLAPIDAG